MLNTTLSFYSVEIDGYTIAYCTHDIVEIASIVVEIESVYLTIGRAIFCIYFVFYYFYSKKVLRGLEQWLWRYIQAIVLYIIYDSWYPKQNHPRSATAAMHNKAKQRKLDKVLLEESKEKTCGCCSKESQITNSRGRRRKSRETIKKNLEINKLEKYMVFDRTL